MADETGVDLRHFFTDSLDLMAVADVDGRFRALNDAWTTVLGWDHHQLIEQPFVSLVHPDDVAGAAAQMAELAGGRPTTAFECRLRCPDGSYRWLQWNARPVGDAIYAVARDVTEDRETQEALRRSEQFLASVVENIPNMVFVKDAAELRFVRMNRAGEQLLGYGRDDLLGKNDFDFFPESEAVFFVEKDRHVLESGELVDIPMEPIETRHGPRLLHTKKIPLATAGGEPEFLLGIAEDITDAVAAARRLHEREQTLSALFRTAPDAILVLAPDLSIVDVNAAGVAIHGMVADERRSPLDHVHPDDRDAVADALRSLVEADGTVARISYRVGTNVGTWLPVEAYGHPLRDEAGRVSGAVVYERDISDAIAAQLAEQQRLRSETEHHLVLDLQRRALTTPPTLPGLETVAHYQPAKGELGMGGDWYQGIALEGGLLGISVGDVVGHGTPAAVDMTQLSGSVATLLRAGAPLEQVLAVADELATALDITATVVVCEIDPTDGTIRYLSAGHPPPIVVSADGSVEFLRDGRRRLLGLCDETPVRDLAVGTARLRPGSTLFAYTDGLVERRGEMFDHGLARLAAALRSTVGMGLGDRVAEVARRCTAGHVIEDDLAIMAVHRA